MQGGFTRIELLIAGVLVAVIATIAVPGLHRSRMAGNEAAAIGSLRAIADAETAYAASCGQNRYTTSLAALPSLPADLAAARDVRGYRFSLVPAQGAIAGGPDCQGRPTVTGFYASAAPLAFGSAGKRAFAVNTAGMIWQAPAAAAPTEPFSAPATPIQ